MFLCLKYLRPTVSFIPKSRTPLCTTSFLRPSLIPFVSLASSIPLSLTRSNSDNRAIEYKLLLAFMAIKADFGADDCLFPPLPPIYKKTIEQQVFTHRSLLGRPSHVFEDLPGDLSPDNERFEHLGDTVLGLCVTELLFHMYPGLHVGPSTKLRGLIVGNTTLAEISLKYKLPTYLRQHAAQAITLRASANIQGPAYVGGLYLDQGLDVVKRWLEHLFRPYAKAAYQAVREQHGLPPLPTPASSPHPSPTNTHRQLPETFTAVSNIGHLALFNQETQKHNRLIEWIYSDGTELSLGNGYVPADAPDSVRKTKGTKTTPVWYVRVLVDGEVYGQGRGNTKKAARNEAAKMGLRKMGIEVW
ncbi:ribonuclease III domain-containing protein [Cyathus striatus]|nr:ribonuclease III domain-containing protein [Cyathus striatus]